MKKITVVALAIFMLLGVFCFAACKKKEGMSLSEYYYMKVDQFKEENKTAEKGQIVFIGDSITDGYALENYYTDLPLKTYNRGIGGDTTHGVLQRMDVSLFAIQPTKIVLMIGINDIDCGYSNNTILQNYNEILRQIQTNLPNAHVFVMSVLSQHPKLAELADIDLSHTVPQIMQLDEALKQLADTYHYTYVDLFAQTVDENNYLISSYTDDGLHLNAAGYTVWANLITPLLKN